MASPIDDISQAIRNALDGAIADSEDTLKAIAAAGAPASGSGQVTSESLVGFITGLVGTLAVLTDPEVLAAIDALKGFESGGNNAGLDFGFGFLLGNLLIPAAEPYVRYLTHGVESLAESQIFDPNTAAELASKGIITPAFGASESSGGGFDATHWNSLLDNAFTRPDVSMAWDMWNRGQISETDFETVLRYQAIPVYWWPAIKNLRQVLLSPADLALATLRGEMDTDTATAYAELTGVTEDDFNTLVLNTGEPPGLMQLLEAYRRGFIDKPTLEHGIRQSRVRDEWIDTIEKLRYEPMSVADAARAVVQNYLSQDDGKKIADQNGLEPDHWQYIYESYGRPLAHEQMMQLYYRGKATRDQVNQAFRESDLKDKYIDQSFELGIKLPALFETVQLLKSGELTQATASRILLEQGYQPEVVKEITGNAGAGKVATPKHLTSAEVISMYDDGLLGADETRTELESLGYSEHDANQLIALADTKTAAALAKAEISIVRSQYNRHQIDKTGAENELTRVGIKPDAAKRLVTQWESVRVSEAKELTPSQILKLVKDELIKPDDAMGRLTSLGYSKGDAELLIEAYG